MVVKPCVSVKMESVMNNLTKEKFKEIYKDDKNLTGKPIFIDFYANW